MVAWERLERREGREVELFSVHVNRFPRTSSAGIWIPRLVKWIIGLHRRRSRSSSSFKSVSYPLQCYWPVWPILVDNEQYYLAICDQNWRITSICITMMLRWRMYRRGCYRFASWVNTTRWCNKMNAVLRILGSKTGFVTSRLLRWLFIVGWTVQVRLTQLSCSSLFLPVENAS